MHESGTFFDSQTDRCCNDQPLNSRLSKKNLLYPIINKRTGTLVFLYLAVYYRGSIRMPESGTLFYSQTDRCCNDQPL
jgi:hypothetical protein